MKGKFLKGILAALLLLCSYNASAYDFTAVNSDGITIYYNITSSKNLTCEVTYGGTSINSALYSGDVLIPETVIYDNNTYNVTKIGDYAFRYCSNLTSITIPESVTRIGDDTFDTCSSLTSVTIPEGVTNIGKDAFQSCSNLTSINIPNSVTSIGEGAFIKCSSLTSFTIPEGITRIEDSTFDRCSSLISITIPNSVTSIGFWAFAWCTSLTSITIPEGVTKIYNYTFDGCESLMSITFLNPEPPTCDGFYIFNNVNKSTCVLYVPEGSLEAYATADTWKDFANIVEIDVTPVIGIEAEDEVEELYRYSIDGKRIDAPQKGINIIKYSDGTIKKVLVK